MKTTFLTASLIAGFAAQAAAQDDFKWQAFYTQTYENVAQVGDVWTAPSNQGALSIVTEENGNHYVYYNHGNQNSRGLYNLDALTADMYEGINEYRLEFDLALTSGTNQYTKFAVGSPDIQTMGSDWATPCGNITQYPNNGLGSGALFALIQEEQSTTSWRVYSQTPPGSNNWIDDDAAAIYVNLEKGVFYHFAITVTPHEATEEEGWNANVTAEIKDAEGYPVVFTNVITDETFDSYTLPYTDEGNGCWFKQFYCLNGRYNSELKIDNIQVMKKVDAGSVTPPTLSMTGVKLEGRVIALDNGVEADALIPYYAVVDEATYQTATSAEGLDGTEYTAPFVVSGEMNYILAWNVNESGKASELARFTCEAGWAPQLNAPIISATDYRGYKKTFIATCDQSSVKPLAPLAYTIFMSSDSLNWEATSTLTVTEGKVYAKVEADGYLPVGCEPAVAPDGAYGSTKWSIAGMVINSTDCPLYNFDNAGKGRVHIPVEYWSEDYTKDDGSITYDAENAWAPLKKNGLHFNGGSGDMFLQGSGNASGFTVTGLVAYNSNLGYITVDNLTEGDIIQLSFNDNTSKVITVEDPETFTIAIPQHGKGAGLASIEIKGAGTIEVRDAQKDTWGILCSSRTVADVERSGATFYEHAYTIYNDQLAADTLLLRPVNSLEAGAAYIYYANADQIELITLLAEEPAEEQSDSQLEKENYTLYATVDEAYEDIDLYTMQPGGILMKGEGSVIVPEWSGYFMNLQDEQSYAESLDFKAQSEYNSFVTSVQSAVDKAVEDWKNAGAYDDEGNWWPEHDAEMTDEEIAALYASTYDSKYASLLGKYVVIPVLHQYDHNVANAIHAMVPETMVNVLTPSGMLLRRGVKASEALRGLKHGLYIVGGRKIAK